MTANNVIWATNSLRSSVSAIKKKVNLLKSSVQSLDSAIEDIEAKFDKVIIESEIFKAKVERETGREVRRLEKELEILRRDLQKSSGLSGDTQNTSAEDLKVASTIAIIECLLRTICAGSEDFRYLSYAILFPAVIERVVKGTEEAYFLEEMPSCSDIIVRRGLEYLSWIRSECDTHLTDPDAWKKFSPLISDWWKNDALPLIYGSRDEAWDIDEPLSDLEMISWRDNIADRPMQFQNIYDAYEIYKTNRDAVYKSSGVQNFEVKSFTHSTVY
jgi:hypothetical protein